MKAAFGLPLLRMQVRGLEIDMQCRKGGVVDLIVRADDQEAGLVRRFAQKVAGALYRVGDALHSREYDRRGVRVVELMVLQQLIGDLQAGGRQPQIIERGATDLANGDTHYDTAVVYEGVKHHQSDFVTEFNIEDRANVSTDYQHFKLPKNAIVLQDTTTSVNGSTR
jgi:hypothetical protein